MLRGISNELYVNKAFVGLNGDGYLLSGRGYELAGHGYELAGTGVPKRKIKKAIKDPSLAVPRSRRLWRRSDVDRKSFRVQATRRRVLLCAS